MADPFIFERDESGVTASHPQTVVLPVIAAPVPDEQKARNFNAIRDPLVVLGCKELPNDHFEFDSSFVGPRSAKAFVNFAKLLNLHKERDQRKRFPPSALFGHADPTGSVGYNRMLSGRRATAVYGVLTKNPDLWDELFSQPYRGDDWGTKAIQTMLSISLITLQPSGLPEAPFYQDDIDGGKTDATRRATAAAVSAWREARGFGKGATLTAAQRKRLFKEYMDAICNGPDFKLAPTDFIAKAQGGRALKGDVMGCGEFNPRFLLTSAAVRAAEKDPDLRDARNEAYKVNRRVIIYVFKHDTEIDPRKWPCPVARSEDDAPCRNRFWSDGDKRRAEAEVERTFGEDMKHLGADEQGQLVETPIEETGNTMACRFYHGFARNSPCEAKFREWVIRFKVPTFGGKLLTLKNRRFVATLGESASAPEIRGATDDGGALRLPMLSEKTRIRIKLDAARDLGPDDDETPPADAPVDESKVDESKFVTLDFDGGVLEFRDIDKDLGIKQRLYNMGYGEHAPATWQQDEFDRAMNAFRERNGLKDAADAAVRERIVTVHDLTNAQVDPEDEDAAAPPSGA
jgi:hypothetical protein